MVRHVNPLDDTIYDTDVDSFISDLPGDPNDEPCLVCESYICECDSTTNATLQRSLRQRSSSWLRDYYIN